MKTAVLMIEMSDKYEVGKCKECQFAIGTDQCKLKALLTDGSCLLNCFCPLALRPEEKQYINDAPKGYKPISKGFFDKTLAKLGLDINEVNGVFICSSGGYVITGNPAPDDETHNCDALGCSSFDHVLYRCD